MIERKRQNDFVRKREFDQLRKLRSRDPASSPDLAGRPSYFQSSMPSNSDERAMTIKKIDEIEAQMSNQWWQGKNSGVPAPGAAPAAARPGDSGESQAPAQAESDPSYAPTRLSPMRPETAVADAEASDFPTTQSHSGFGPSTGPTELPVSQSPVEDSARAAPASGLGRGFMHSRPTCTVPPDSKATSTLLPSNLQNDSTAPRRRGFRYLQTWGSRTPALWCVPCHHGSVPSRFGAARSSLAPGRSMTCALPSPTRCRPGSSTGSPSRGSSPGRPMRWPCCLTNGAAHL